MNTRVLVLVPLLTFTSTLCRQDRPLVTPSAPRQRGAHRRALAWEPRLLVSRLGRGMASIVALLDTFDDAASLSRAAALADDMQRQRAVLQDELAAVEQALPAALAAVQSNTRSAIEQLDRLADERSALEERSKAHMSTKGRQNITWTRGSGSAEKSALSMLFDGAQSVRTIRGIERLN